MCWIFCLSSTYAFLLFVFLSCFGPHLTLNLPLLVLWFFRRFWFLCYKEIKKANFLHVYRVWVFCSPNTPFFKCSFLLPALVFLVNFLCFSCLFPLLLLPLFFPFKLSSSFFPFLFASIFLSSFFLCFNLSFFFCFLVSSFLVCHNSNSGVCPQMPRKRGKIDKHVYFPRENNTLEVNQKCL